MQIELKINREVKRVEIEPFDSLLKVLRKNLGLTGTKENCNQGECGACTILMNGKAVNACLVLAATADNAEITTIEGLSGDGRLDPVQEAFIALDASQCGFCTPGMIMSAKGLLNEKPLPDSQSIQTAIEGNLCRCTGYKQIMEAIHSAAKE